MLRKSEERLLQWMVKQATPLSAAKIEGEYKNYRKQDLKSLYNQGYIRTTYNPDTEWMDYVVDPKGEGYLRSAWRDTAVDVREWITLGIAVLALILSVISIALQYMR